MAIRSVYTVILKTSAHLLLVALLGVLAACGGGDTSGGGVNATTIASSALNGPLVSIASNMINIKADVTDNAGPTYQLPLTFGTQPGSEVYIAASTDSAVIQSVSTPTNGSTNPQVSVVFNSPKSLGVGIYTTAVQMSVCAFHPCGTTEAVQLVVTFNYIVTLPALTPLNQVQLSHDVIDAKYSRALDSIVMVSATPSNALYLYNTNTKVEVSQPLNAVPTVVNLGPSGLDAAIGHATSITYVNLVALTQPNPPQPVQLNVSAPVFDLVLDGNGNVHSIPSGNAWTWIHSINIATNVETLSSGGTDGVVFGGSHARLQPGTQFLFTSDHYASAGGLTEWDVSSGSAALAVDYSLSFGSACGNLWFAEDGVTVYSACGSIFSISDLQPSGTANLGTLPVGQVNLYSAGNTQALHYSLVSVDESDSAREILAVESSQFACDFALAPAGCLTEVDVYDSMALTAAGKYSLPNVTVAGQSYLQRALFAFHSGNGTHRMVLGTLFGGPSTPAQFYLSNF